MNGMTARREFLRWTSIQTMILVNVLFQRQFIEGLTSGALKG